MKLEVHKGEKVSEPDFGGKLPFCPKLGKNGPKMDLLYIFQIPVPVIEVIHFQLVLDPKFNQESNEPI